MYGTNIFCFKHTFFRNRLSFILETLNIAIPVFPVTDFVRTTFPSTNIEAVRTTLLSVAPLNKQAK